MFDNGAEQNILIRRDMTGWRRLYNVELHELIHLQR